MIRPLLLAFLLAAPLAAQTQDPAPPSGAPTTEAFAACAACHTPGESTPNPGPDLRGVIGRASAKVPGFRYSRAMKNARLVWDEATLDAYLADPQAVVPGTTMPFPGEPDADRRAEILAALKALK